MKILVTGAAGFLGSHLTDRLLERGDRVVGLDCFDDFYDPARKRRNLRGALASEQFRLEEGDIRDEDLVARIAAGADAVVHLAARAGVRPSIERPGLYASVNVEGTVSVLEACRKAGVDRLVFASSSSVYGGIRDLPFREDLKIDRPVSPYGATKAACELLLGTWAHLHRIKACSLRYFTVYGPRQRPEMAIHKFTRRMAEGRAVPVFGDGTSRRDYTYVEDVVAGTLAALDELDTFGPGHRVYNIGGNRTVELRQLVSLIAERLGVEPLVETHPDQPGDVRATWADITRATADLGWEPKTPIEAGLTRFVDWYREEGEQGRKHEQEGGP